MDSNAKLDLGSVQVTVKKLVLAGSYKEYLAWRQQNAKEIGCKYVEGIEDIEGYTGYFVDLVFYGNYTKNPLYHTPEMQALISEYQSPFRAYIKAS